MPNPFPITRSDQQIHHLKRLAATVYLCQMLTFVLAGFPLILCVLIYFYKRKSVRGTWLQSHFEWQIRTIWGVLIGLALAAMTFATQIGIYLVLVTTIIMIYRISVGWFALTDGKAID